MKRFPTGPSRSITLGTALLVTSVLAGNGGIKAAPAVSGKLTIQSASIGLDGVFKMGHWAPLRITLLGGSEDCQAALEISTLDGDGCRVAYRQREHDLFTVSAGSEVTVERYVKLGRINTGVTVRVLSEDRELASQTFGDLWPAALRSTQPLIVTLGEGIGVEQAVKRRLRDRANPVVATRVENAATLPRRWYGYDAVDAVVVPTSEVSLLEQMDDEQFAAFDRWLKLGGQMILCVGARGEQVFAEGHRLRRYCAGDAAEVRLQRSTTGLMQYAGATDRLAMNRSGVFMTVIRNPRGRVENDEMLGAQGRVPTILRFPYGLGQVVFVAFDLDQPPFADWQGREGLVARVLQGDRERSHRDTDTESLGEVTHLGFKDLTGQLRAAMDQFDGVTRVEFSRIAVIVAIYILMIGPVDYLLIRRLRRWHWTWFTFPVVVLLFCILAWTLHRRLSGDRIHINQVELIDVDLDSHLLRGQSWLHIYSPQCDEFDLSLRLPGEPWGDYTKETCLLSWQGLPGDGLGGVDGPGRARDAFREYRIWMPGESGSHASIAGLPIDFSSSRSLCARWSADIPGDVDHSRYELAADSNGLLIGRVVNPLEIDLRDCIVVYANWAYSIPGALRAGDAMAMDGLDPRNLEWRLTRRKVVETRDVSTPWEKTSFDIPRIVEMMMFHKAAGGENYTGLTHLYQPDVDLTDHLRTGQAILIGHGDSPVTSMYRRDESLDGYRDRCWTIYRVLIPVDTSGKAADRD